jgi:2'-5' RNA ligase
LAPQQGDTPQKGLLKGQDRVVTAVVCAAFDPATDEAVYAVRERVRAAGVPLPDRPPHRPHFSLSAARVPRESLDAVVAVAAAVAARHEPVPVALAEVGRFGRAGALWLRPAPNRGLPAMQRDAYRAMRQAGWPPAFGERSAPRLWVAHCTLATRVAKPLLRDLQAALAADYDPIRGVVDALAVILVGGRGDVAHLPLGAAHAPA